MDRAGQRRAIIRPPMIPILPPVSGRQRGIHQLLKIIDDIMQRISILKIQRHARIINILGDLLPEEGSGAIRQPAIVSGHGDKGQKFDTMALPVIAPDHGLIGLRDTVQIAIGPTPEKAIHRQALARRYVVPDTCQVWINWPQGVSSIGLASGCQVVTHANR